MNSFRYPHKRPQLTIELIGGKNISRCYDEHTWKITSTFKLKPEKIKALYELGLVGFGQEFVVVSQCDGKEQPAGKDEVACVETTPQGIELPGPAINPYTDEPYKPTFYSYYEYICVSRCDSGD